MFVRLNELKCLDAKSIAHSLWNDEFCQKKDVNPDKYVGVGFDGCSPMTGKDGGV